VTLNFSVPAWAQKGTIKIAVQDPQGGTRTVSGGAAGEEC
jgi:hypothetical protein